MSRLPPVYSCTKFSGNERAWDNESVRFQSRGDPANGTVPACSKRMKGCSANARRILVVDDESLVCHMVTILLKVDGHSVTTAGSGEQALAVFEPGKFDLIVTDYAMPAMTGAELAAAIKQRAPEQPIVLLTAYAEKLRTQPETLASIDFIIEKPLSIESIRRAINTFALAPKLAAAS